MTVSPAVTAAETAPTRLPMRLPLPLPLPLDSHRLVVPPISGPVGDKLDVPDLRVVLFDEHLRPSLDTIPMLNQPGVLPRQKKTYGSNNQGNKGERGWDGDKVDDFV